MALTLEAELMTSVIIIVSYVAFMYLVALSIGLLGSAF